mmetsp:Transcript_79492/g.222954  ORF Transcript_79492/g.222954 Transcript_79492/m.222954 type:complete len:211 (+) Transcript_79492:1523-2155(+)
MCTSLMAPTAWKTLRMCFSRASNARFRKIKREALGVCRLLSTARKLTETRCFCSFAPLRTSRARLAFASFRNDAKNAVPVPPSEESSPKARRITSIPQPPGSFSSIQACTAALETLAGRPFNCTVRRSSRPKAPPLGTVALDDDAADVAGASAPPTDGAEEPAAGATALRPMGLFGFAAANLNDAPSYLVSCNSVRHRRASASCLNFTRP